MTCSPRCAPATSRLRRADAARPRLSARERRIAHPYATKVQFRPVTGRTGARARTLRSLGLSLPGSVMSRPSHLRQSLLAAVVALALTPAAAFAERGAVVTAARLVDVD